LEFAGVKSGLDHPEAEVSSGARVWRAARTALLLLAGAVASVYMVQPPVSATGGPAKAPTHIPVSGKWVELGNAAASPSNGLQAAFAADNEASAW
jgi:hypothetical protein